MATLTQTAKGYWYWNGIRVSASRAAELQAELRAAASKVQNQPRRTGFDFDRLNQPTQGLFWRLADQLWQEPLRLGHGISIALVDAPRLTNLKKAGLFCTWSGTTKSHRYLALTEAGRDLWASKA